MNLEQSLRKAFDVGYDTPVDETSFLAEQRYGINIELNDDVAMVSFYAHTQEGDIPIVQKRLLDMVDRLRVLRFSGYDVSEAELVHEDQTTDTKEYRIPVPVHTQEELDLLVGTLANIKTYEGPR